MAITVSNLEFGSLGNLRCTTGTISMDNGYPTGGEALTKATLGLPSEIRFIMFEPTGGLCFEYDHTNEKVLAYVPGLIVGAAGGHTLDDYDLEGVGATTAGYAIGLEASITQSTTMRFGLMKEVANNEDLSTITGVNFFAVGS